MRVLDLGADVLSAGPTLREISTSTSTSNSTSTSTAFGREPRPDVLTAVIAG